MATQTRRTTTTAQSGLKVKTHIKAGLTVPKLDGSSKDA
jgi:hypothetical protein